MMVMYTDERVGKILAGLFLIAAAVLATLVFLFASRPDDSWVAPQAEKQSEEALQRFMRQLEKNK
jgi:lipopolysaccharide export LptBFGC system permease protein LptF